jgi:predicted hydrocarbon binding protein
MISPFLQKLMFVRQFSIADGKIDLLGQNYVMLDALALYEMQKIDQTKLYEALKNSALKNMAEAVESAKVYKNVRDVFLESIAKLGNKIGQSDQGTLMTLREIFNVYGLGSLEIVNLDNSKKQALLRLNGSTIAQEYKKKYSKSKCTVDVVASGILAGIFSYVFKKQVDCVEKKCIAAGDGYCEFYVA